MGPGRDAAIPFEPFVQKHMVVSVRHFTQVMVELDEAREAPARVAALQRYFSRAAPADAAWGLWLLLGKRLKPSISAAQLQQWAGMLSGHSEWLLEECVRCVGDGVEAATLLLPTAEAGTLRSLAALITDEIQTLADWDGSGQLDRLRALWAELDRDQALIVHKLASGSFRPGATRTEVMEALSRWSGLGRVHLEHRLAGRWQPTGRVFDDLVTPKSGAPAPYQPYPFATADAFDSSAEGNVKWAAEWWWEGCRAQLIKRGGSLHLWSDAGERLSSQFPEICDSAAYLENGTVLDGIVLVWHAGRDLPGSPLELEQRRRRERPTTSTKKKFPVVFLASDLLECGGADWRARAWSERRVRLETAMGALPAESALRLAPLAGEGRLAALEDLRAVARSRGALGLVLKKPSAGYGEGGGNSRWRLWRVNPLSLPLAMVYAEADSAGRGKRFSHYTLAARNGEGWQSVAKVERLANELQATALDDWIKVHADGRRGPVRLVPPRMIFEIAFDGASPAPRLKSGLSLLHPRVLRWMQGEDLQTVATLADIEAIIPE